MQVKSLEKDLPTSEEAPCRCWLLLLLVTHVCHWAADMRQVLCQELGTQGWTDLGVALEDSMILGFYKKYLPFFL